jgi:hypothetical protein
MNSILFDCNRYDGKQKDEITIFRNNKKKQKTDRYNRKPEGVNEKGEGLYRSTYSDGFWPTNNLYEETL